MMAAELSGSDQQGGAGPGQQRLDRWLWFSRVLKSRTMAAQLVEAGKVRVNRTRVVKPSHGVRPGDVLTIALRGRVQVLRVLAAGARRGPPLEARQLYQVLSDGRSVGEKVAVREPGAARPSKRDRRLIERLIDPE
jgi:ribosome-associated heat shock protein Hsp15